MGTTRYLTTTLVFLCGSTALVHAQHAPPGGMLEAETPGGRYVVVDAGPKEPASIGSYAVRLYSAANAQHAADDFIASAVASRDGTLERLEFADVTGDGSQELVVIAASAGTGGYLAADAFRLTNDSVVHVASADGLQPNADVIAALRKRAG